MEAGLTSRLSSENLKYSEVFNLLAPFYLSIGMTLDEFWKGKPELVLVYIDAEVFRATRRERDLWRQGAYIRVAVASALNSENEYYEEPIPVSVQAANDYRARKEAENLERTKAAVASWLKRGGSTTNLSDEEGGQSQ